MPNRILYESVCRSDTLAQLDAYEERLFYRLLTQADDFGRFDARPAIIRAACFPLAISTTSEAKIQRWIDGLVGVGVIVLYAPHFGYFETWDKYQRVRAKRSRYPDPADIGGHPRADDSKLLTHVPARAESDLESDLELVQELPPMAGNGYKDTPKPNGWSDLQYGLVKKLQGIDEVWTQLTPPRINKLNRDYGKPVVIQALQHMLEEKNVPAEAFPLLRAVCLTIKGAA